MNENCALSTVVPFSLKNAPAFIECQMPVGRVSAETYKERKSGAGQTLTALGSYWKGRKPLVLVRAAVLGCLLPATSDPLADLRIFLMLMGMDDAAFARRIKSISPAQIDPAWSKYDRLIVTGEKPRWRETLSKGDRVALIAEWLTTLPYDDRLAFCFRPEEIQECDLLNGIWDDVNSHLNTNAASIAELVEQLGIMRFGHRPRLADTFCGGGSIPFEAASIGCDVHATDLNPIACMLTWGAFNILGATAKQRAKIESEEKQVAAAVDAEIVGLGIEHDSHGNRAKAYLYCLETQCPKTGWMVPLAPSWIISKTRFIIAVLKPVREEKRYEIEIRQVSSAKEMKEAENGTLRGGRLVHPMNPDTAGVAISVIRKERKDANGEILNGLREWGKHDFRPIPSDIFQERLYCIQWMTAETLHKAKPETFFAAPTQRDMEAEKRVEEIVASNLSIWQQDGIVPDSRIEPGAKTDEPIRTRGWTYWHHLYYPRQLQMHALYELHSRKSAHPEWLFFSKFGALDRNSKLIHWHPGAPSRPGVAVTAEKVEQVFYNNALNTFLNPPCRSFASLKNFLVNNYDGAEQVTARSIKTCDAKDIDYDADIFVTDPPYADAVYYHELTEYFVSWAEKYQPKPFREWIWNTRRPLAIQGTDEKFRADMVAAYRSMAAHMPQNGIQVVMFTHQDAGVWADLAAIMWAAGLRVSAAWNIVTETASALKEGNYVQGTILLVLRKRLGAGNAKRMDIEGEIETEVDKQIKALHDLADDWTSERLYTDGDLQLAAYAAALRVITNYETIDRVQVGADVYRKLKKGERTVIRDLIDYAASVANNKLVPDGFPPVLWRDLDKTSRFYVRMLDMEFKGTTKAADFMDFAKTFSVPDYKEFMASTKANEAALAGAEALKAKSLGGPGFGSEPLRRVLFAVYKTIQRDDPKDGLQYLKNEFGTEYWTMRAKLIEFAKYIAGKTARTRPNESAAADLLAQKLEVDRV